MPLVMVTMLFGRQGLVQFHFTLCLHNHPSTLHDVHNFVPLFMVPLSTDTDQAVWWGISMLSHLRPPPLHLVLQLAELPHDQLHLQVHFILYDGCEQSLSMLID